jgi:hypothetical protein
MPETQVIEMKARTKEDIDREYSHLAILIGDRSVKVDLLQQEIEEFQKKAQLLVSEANELERKVIQVEE